MLWYDTPVPPAAKTIRIIVLLLLVAAIATAVVLLTCTERGQWVTGHPHEAGHEFQHWVQHHRLLAPLIFIALYTILVLLMLPVWWMQILAGYGFGLVIGVAFSQIGATIGATGGMLISRFIAADWFHQRVETRLKKLRDIDEKMGHNGFLVVMAVRLMHFIPIGISNYVFGLTAITVADVVVGTVLGGIPAVAMYVGIGAGYHPWRNWRFIVVIVAINGVLLIPLLLRYLRPQWFRKYGIE